MIKIRKSNERGFADHGWLRSYHSFSFASYHDPNHMGFRSLRVINEDYIKGGTGFGSHPHHDMEIITYVTKGSLEHKDSMGNTSIIRPGEVQKMSAGTGVVHSEYSKSDDETHLLQIWIIPNVRGIKPGYEQKSFENELNSNKLVLAASADGRHGSISIKQDADIYASRLKKDDNIEFKVRPQRGVWIQVIKGDLEVNGKKIHAGDALSAEDEEVLKITALDNSEFIMFDFV